MFPMGTLVMSGDIFGCCSGDGGGVCAKLPTVHPGAPPPRIIQPTISIVQKLSNSDLERG